LTGETATESGVRPRSEFGFGKGGLGAFQVAARYHALKVDPRAVTSGLAAPGASPHADAWTVGLNWYLTRNVRYTFNVERTAFEDAATGRSRRAENAFVFRTQVNF
ncbi:MAG TPA: porin, partial [Vicinamibacterales bacterium]